MPLLSNWIDFIYTTAVGKSKKKYLLASLGGVGFVCTISFIVLGSFYVDRIAGLPSLFGEPWNLILGLPIIMVGLFLTIGAIVQFVNVRGTPVPLMPPPKLVTTGLYRYSRNPMVTGLLLQIFGFGIVSRSLTMTFIVAPLLLLGTIWELKKVEEPELEKRLGKEYAEYKKRVPMFFKF